MRNISSYLTIGLLLSFNSYASEIMNNPNSVDVALSNIRPEITLSNNSLTGYSSLLGQRLDVTYNDKEALNSHLPEDNKEKIASIDEPVVINEWAIKVGDSIKSQVPTEIQKEIAERVIESALNKKEQEIIFKENNLSEENPVVFSDMSYIPEKTTSFAFNKIESEEPLEIKEEFNNNDILSEEEQGLSEPLTEDGIGIVGKNIKDEDLPELTFQEKQDITAIKAEKSDKEVSPWSIATVRGKASNRFATIGSIKDLKNNDKKESSSLNPWAKGFKKENNTKEIVNNKMPFSPPQKINQWSIRGENNAFPEVSNLIDMSFLEENKADYDKRWTNHQRAAVLINNITSKPLYKNGKNQFVETDLKEDELNQVFKNDNQPKKLLTKIEEDKEDAVDVNKIYYETPKTSDIVPYSPLKTSHIGLNEIRLNFRPNFADLSLQSVKLVGNFANRIASTPNSVIEIRMSDKAYNLQTNRVTIIKQILNSNGISDDRINITTTNRDVDTMVLRLIVFTKKKSDIINKSRENKVKSW